MPPDPNQIDISLSLLPGESEDVINDLISTMRTVAAQLAAIAGGDEYAAMAGPVARVGATASTAIHGERPEMGVNASRPPGYEPAPEPEIWLPPAAAEERAAARAKAKLGAAAQAAEDEAPTEVVDNASMPPDAPRGWSEPEEHPIQEAMDRSWRQQAIDRAKDAVLVRKEQTDEQAATGAPGSIDIRGSSNSLRDWAMTYGIFRNGRGGVHDEVAQLKSSFRPDDVERLGTEFGGTQAPTTDIFGLKGVLPGRPLLEAVKGLLGDDSSRESAGYKGAKAEFESLWQGFKDPYLTQNEARQLTHGAAAQGWNTDQAEQRRDRFSRLRSNTPGLRSMDPRAYGDFEDQTLRGGGSSMKELNAAIRAMPAAAQAAHMGLDEYIESAKNYAETLTRSGASFGRAAMAAPSWSAATGMAPQVAEAVRQSPMVQGQLYAQGFTPATEGLASSGILANATSQSIEELAGIYQGGFQDIVTETDSGKHVVTAEEQINAQIAQDVGLPNADAVARFRAHAGRAGQAADATMDIDEYQRGASRIEKKLTGRGLSDARRWMRTGEGAPDEAVTRPEVMRQLEAAGVNDVDLDEVRSAKSATAFAAAARDALSRTTESYMDDTVGENETINERIAVDVNVRMKGAAAALFEDIRTDTDVARGARRKARRPGGGSYNHNNPDQTPPKKGFVDIIRNLGAGTP